MRRTVGDIAIEVMQREQYPYIGYCDFGLLDTVHGLAVAEGICKPVNHPIRAQTAVLNCLDRDKRFVKWYVLAMNRNGRGERRVRSFRLKGASDA